MGNLSQHAMHGAGCRPFFAAAFAAADIAQPEDGIFDRFYVSIVDAIALGVSRAVGGWSWDRGMNGTPRAVGLRSGQWLSAFRIGRPFLF